MLNATKRIVFSGESVIEGVTACVFSATIPLNDPEKTSIGNFQKDKEIYKNHREECRADFAKFEDMVIAEQTKILETTK